MLSLHLKTAAPYHKAQSDYTAVSYTHLDVYKRQISVCHGLHMHTSHTVYKTVLYWSEKTVDTGYVFLLESRFHVRRLPVHTAQSGSLLNIADKIHCLNWSPESNLFPLSDNGTCLLYTSYADAAEWETKAKDLAQRFVKNFAKYEGNEAGKALVSAGPEV